MLKELWMTLLLPSDRKLKMFSQVCELLQKKHLSLISPLHCNWRNIELTKMVAKMPCVDKNTFFTEK